MTIRTLALLTVLLGTTAAAQSSAPPPPPGPESLNASKKDRPKNVLYTGPVALLFQHWHVEYERVITPNVSAYVIPTLISRGSTGTVGSTTTSTRERIFGADFGARFFPGAEAPEGFFVAALLSAFHSTFNYTDSDDNVTLSGPLFNLGVQVGYTTLVADVFAISVGLGAGYGITPVRPVTITFPLGGNVDTTPMPIGLPWSSFNINSRLSFGFAF